MSHFNCNYKDAVEVINLRDEGYSMCQANMMAGVTDPSYWNKESDNSNSEE
jgi:hypothetical protein